MAWFSESKPCWEPAASASLPCIVTTWTWLYIKVTNTASTVLAQSLTCVFHQSVRDAARAPFIAFSSFQQHPGGHMPRRRLQLRQPSREPRSHQHPVNQLPRRALPRSLVVYFASRPASLTDDCLCCYQSASDLITLVVLQPLPMDVGTTACISVLYDLMYCARSSHQFAGSGFLNLDIQDLAALRAVHDLTRQKVCCSLLDVLYVGLHTLQV